MSFPLEVGGGRRQVPGPWLLLGDGPLHAHVGELTESFGAEFSLFVGDPPTEDPLVYVDAVDDEDEVGVLERSVMSSLEQVAVEAFGTRPACRPQLVNVCFEVEGASSDLRNASSCCRSAGESMKYFCAGRMASPP